jgi:hypothetical protein
VDLVKAAFPGIPTVITYCNQTAAPPAALDWISIDPYLWTGYDNSGCTSRDHFDQAIARLGWAASFGKPVMLIPPSFRRTVPSEVPMPSVCQQQWYMAAAMAEPRVRAVVWFMYGHAMAATRGEEISGAGEFPDVLAAHRALWDNVRYGGWGAQLAVGDLDGDGRGEIVVGHGEGPGNTTGLRVYAADGTPVAAPFVAYPGAHYGVSLAVGRFAR